MSVHIGSQITDVQPFALTMERVAELVRVLQGDGHRIEYVDAGGGLGIDYQEPIGAGFRRAGRRICRRACCVRCAD